MALHKDFIKIHSRFIAQYGEQGEGLYSAFVEKKGYDDTKPFPQKGERKEHFCSVRGLEIKEEEEAFHVEGLVATTHIDDLDKAEGIEMSDVIPKETLESFAKQINTTLESRVMGVHHSEGRSINPEYYGVADVDTSPAKVVTLTDGHHGLYVDTKLLKEDPETPNIIKEFEDGTLNSFSITYDTEGFMTTDFAWFGDTLVRVLKPETKLYGYTAASNPVNPQAVATGYGFKEFKELMDNSQIVTKEVEKMPEDKEMKEDSTPEVEEAGVPQPSAEGETAPEKEAVEQPSTDAVEEPVAETTEEPEAKEFETKELIKSAVEKIANGVLSKMETKEKVLKDNAPSNAETKEISLELKEFRDVVENPTKIEIKEQFRRAAALADHLNLKKNTSAAESREYKNFGVNGTKLEFKGLGITTNQNTDTDYLQSTAELQDMYDPIIYNALNQVTVLWNLLAKDDFSAKGNNQVQFTLKIAANASAKFYTGNAVSTDNVARLKYQTKFKKVQVGVSVDGDMIAAARGGPVSDVFAQEVMDSTMDMLSVVNTALFAEVGLETVADPIGLEYITDSAGNTTLYNLTRSAANKLAPGSASDTYINGSSAIISMFNLRSAITQAVTEGANKSNLIFVTAPVQGNLLRGKFDDARRHLTSADTSFGFTTDLFIDGIPVFEDKDCNTDDWFLIDTETHRVGMWIPPTIERLGKNADSEDAFVKMYFATYNRAPRRMVQIYGNATS